MKALSWILLLLGVALAGAGGARNGQALADVFAHQAPADMLASAASSQQAAFARHAHAMDALRAAPPDQVEAATQHAQEALGEVQAARARLGDLRATGLYDGSVTAAVSSLQASVPARPDPTARLLDWLTVGGPWWGGGVLLVAIGAFLARRSASAASRDPAASGGGVDFAGTVRRILADLANLSESIQDLPMDAPSLQLREEIDRIQDECITPLIEGRGQLQARHGTTGFAVYFGAFSGGERNLARVWSALTDGHSVVARDSLQRSIAGFEEALHEWERAEDQGSTDPG